jgi:hypothetical protein
MPGHGANSCMNYCDGPSTSWNPHQDIRELPGARWKRHSTPLSPKCETNGLQQPAHHTHRKGAVVRLHEFEEPFAFGVVSCANHAAAFARISRSRRSWRSSSRSLVVRPPSPLPASRSACLTHKAIDHGAGVIWSSRLLERTWRMRQPRESARSSIGVRGMSKWTSLLVMATRYRRSK